MANFKQAVEKIFQLEGGYQAWTNDTGNYNSLGHLVGTNWGISAPVYERWIGKPPTLLEMRNMPKQVAEEIYKARFWDRIQGSRISPQYLADIIMDGAVNHGVSRGVKLLQEVLGVYPDGIMGEITLAAIRRANPARLFEAYKQRRVAFYNSLAASNPAYRPFLDGWMNRINSFAATAAPTASIILIAAAIWFFHKKRRYAYTA